MCVCVSVCVCVPTSWVSFLFLSVLFVLQKMGKWSLLFMLPLPIHVNEALACTHAHLPALANVPLWLTSHSSINGTSPVKRLNVCVCVHKSSWTSINESRRIIYLDPTSPLTERARGDSTLFLVSTLDSHLVWHNHNESTINLWVIYMRRTQVNKTVIWANQQMRMLRIRRRGQLKRMRNQDVKLAADNLVGPSIMSSCENSATTQFLAVFSKHKLRHVSSRSWLLNYLQKKTNLKQLYETQYNYSNWMQFDKIFQHNFQYFLEKLFYKPHSPVKW